MTEPTFSELVSNLPSSRRAPKVYAMLALHKLEARDSLSAKPTAEVDKFLKSHLRSKAPGNPSDVLSKAVPCVERLGEGRKIRWYLTGTGYGELQRLGLLLESGAPQAVNMSGYDYDVAFVCALHDPELTSLLSAFGGEDKWEDVQGANQLAHKYKQTAVLTEAGDSLKVVAGAPTYMGLTATAILATQMIFTFRPRLVFMVGVAAGTRSDRRGFGDILVADPSVDYASGKLAHLNGSTVFQPDPYPLNIDVNLRTTIQEDVRIRAGLDEISRAWGGGVPASGDLRVHIGALGAADQVVDSAERLAEVQKNWRKLIGIEMETYALYRAAYEAPSPKPLHLSFKSVCDFAAEKTDGWQHYAAFTAAAYARRFLVKHWDVVKRKTS